MTTIDYNDLHRATIDGNLSKVERVVTSFDVNATATEDLHTPLMMACQLGRLEIAKFLLKKGADIHMRDREGHTALHWAVLKLEQPALVQMLIDEGAKVDATTEVGLTPLCYAAIMGFAGNCAVLLRAGANKDRRCKHWTPEQLAQQNGHTDVAKLIGASRP